MLIAHIKPIDAANWCRVRLKSEVVVIQNMWHVLGYFGNKPAIWSVFLATLFYTPPAIPPALEKAATFTERRIVPPLDISAHLWKTPKQPEIISEIKSPYTDLDIPPGTMDLQWQIYWRTQLADSPRTGYGYKRERYYALQVPYFEGDPDYSPPLSRAEIRDRKRKLALLIAQKAAEAAEDANIKPVSWTLNRAIDGYAKLLDVDHWLKRELHLYVGVTVKVDPTLTIKNSENRIPIGLMSGTLTYKKHFDDFFTTELDRMPVVGLVDDVIRAGVITPIAYTLRCVAAGVSEAGRVTGVSNAVESSWNAVGGEHFAYMLSTPTLERDDLMAENRRITTELERLNKREGMEGKYIDSYDYLPQSRYKITTAAAVPSAPPPKTGAVSPAAVKPVAPSSSPSAG